ncbi:MAG: glycosyltransferase family 4 protein [Litorilinea sp.]
MGAYTAELGAALVAQGAAVRVLTSTQAGADRPPGADDTRRGVQVRPVVAGWGPSIWTSVRRQARDFGAEWIHIQYQTAAFHMNPAVNLGPWGWRRQARVAWTYHDLLVPYLFPKAGAALRRWITHLPARLCDLPIVTNEGDRLALAAQGIAAQKSPIGSNIAARAFAPTDVAALRQARGYAPADVVVGYFGFLNRSKGGLTLVRTLDALRHAGLPAHLLMIGERVGASDPTNYAYLQAVEAEIAQRDLTARVSWTGRLDDADVSAALAVCDVLLMPYTDGVSLRRGTLMAGLAHGCAVVTTFPQSLLPELVDGEHLYYVPPEDPQAAAHAVQRLVTDSRLAQRVRHGARTASQAFRWDTIARQHLEFYATPQ